MLLCSNALFVVLVERRSTSPQNAAPVLGRTRLSAVTSTVINFAPHLGQFVTSAPATGRRTGVQDQGGHRVHAVLKRQALAAGLKPPNHKRVYRVMKVHGLLLDRHVGGDERRHDGRIWMNVIGVGAPTALRSAATTASGCGLRLRSTAVIGKP